MAKSVPQVVEKTTVFRITSFLPVNSFRDLIILKTVMKVFSYFPAESQNVQKVNIHAPCSTAQVNSFLGTGLADASAKISGYSFS
jgi:hypothetical protein